MAGGYAMAFWGPRTYARSPITPVPVPITTSFQGVLRNYTYSGGWNFASDGTYTTPLKMGWEHNSATIKLDRSIWSFTAGSGDVGKEIWFQVNTSAFGGTPSAYSLYWLTPTPALDFAHVTGGTAFASAITPATGTVLYDTGQVVASAGQTFSVYAEMDNDIALAQASSNVGVDNHLVDWDNTPGTGCTFAVA